MRYLHEEASGPLKPKELARALDVPHADYAEFRRALARLEGRGKIYRVRGGRFAAPRDLGLVIGRLQTIESGAGFVIPDEGDEDVFVRARDLGTAVDGDRVTVRVDRRERRGPRGSVIEVLERAHRRAVGVFRRGRGVSWLEVSEPRLGVDVFIPAAASGEAADGDVVVVEITDWDGGPSPVGAVERVLGRPGDPGVEVLAIQVGYGLAEAHPPEVESLAAELNERGILPEDLEGRKDCRAQRVITIDPVDARDHDDALAVERLPDGGLRVGVHIADVSHFVRPGTPLDDEARDRAKLRRMVVAIEAGTAERLPRRTPPLEQGDRADGGA